MLRTAWTPLVLFKAGVSLKRPWYPCCELPGLRCVLHVAVSLSCPIHLCLCPFVWTLPCGALWMRPPGRPLPGREAIINGCSVSGSSIASLLNVRQHGLLCSGSPGAWPWEIPPRRRPKLDSSSSLVLRVLILRKWRSLVLPLWQYPARFALLRGRGAKSPVKYYLLTKFVCVRLSESSFGTAPLAASSTVRILRVCGAKSPVKYYPNRRDP